MPDVVVLAQNVTVKLPSATDKVAQPVEESFDASPYVGFRLQPVLLAQNPAGTADGITLDLLTSMTKDADDGSWKVVGSVTIAGTSSVPEWSEMLVPTEGSGVPLFRYVRWRVSRKTSGTTTSATFSILGMADRT